jgi:hypothetical protein
MSKDVKVKLDRITVDDNLDPTDIAKGEFYFKYQIYADGVLEVNPPKLGEEKMTKGDTWNLNKLHTLNDVDYGIKIAVKLWDDDPGNNPDDFAIGSKNSYKETVLSFSNGSLKNQVLDIESGGNHVYFDIWV